jgi:hypothetical protein
MGRRRPRFRFHLAVTLLAVSVALAAGCSRQPKLHIGEWEDGASVAMRLSEDGTFVHLTMNPGGPVTQWGKYKIDYSKDPIQLDVFFNDNTTRFAIVRFLGEDKKSMELAYTREGKDRPAGFVKSPDVSSFAMTRIHMSQKVKKERQPE